MIVVRKSQSALKNRMRWDKLWTKSQWNQQVFIQFAASISFNFVWKRLRAKWWLRFARRELLFEFWREVVKYETCFWMLQIFDGTCSRLSLWEHVFMKWVFNKSFFSCYRTGAGEADLFSLDSASCLYENYIRNILMSDWLNYRTKRSLPGFLTTPKQRRQQHCNKRRYQLPNGKHTWTNHQKTNVLLQKKVMITSIKTTLNSKLLSPRK